MTRAITCSLSMALLTLLVTASAQEPAPPAIRPETATKIEVKAFDAPQDAQPKRVEIQANASTTVEVEAVDAPQDAQPKKDAIPRIMDAAKAVMNLRVRAEAADAEARRVAEIQRIEVMQGAMELQVRMRNIPDEIIQSYSQQLRPIMRGDLHLIRSLCDPTEEQRQQLAEAADDLLPELARKLIEAQQTNNGNLDVVRLFSEELAGSVEAILGPKQVALYLAEVEARDLARKRAAAGALMAAIEPFVQLSAEQREQLRPALIDRWDDSWFQAAEMARNNPQFMPAIPEECLTGVLTESQMTAWRSRSDTTIRFGGLYFGQPIDNSALNPDEPPPLVPIEPPPPMANPAGLFIEPPVIIR